MPDESRRKSDLLLPLSLFFITIVSRIPFASNLLYHMDSVHFALALEKYDITVHQPHPPGYFLYVMLGKILHLFIEDANTVFVAINIFFSGLTVVAVYLLGSEMFDRKMGFIAAALAITSPNLWFHSEVALSYIVEAFFSTAVAYLCWKILKGQHKYVWLSAILLGIAGGVRQNTAVFLFPLWLYSVKEVAPRKVFAAIVLLGVVCLSWFLPMVQMTGGWHVYREAFRELWLFNTGNVSVFEKGWSSFRIFSSTLFDFTFYGIGVSIFVLCLAAYSLIRNKKIGGVDRYKIGFFALWIAPPVLFYLLIFIHPANPGYILIYLPALYLLGGSSIGFLSEESITAYRDRIAFGIASFVVATNACIFFFLLFPCRTVRSGITIGISG